MHLFAVAASSCSCSRAGESVSRLVAGICRCFSLPQSGGA